MDKIAPQHINVLKSLSEKKTAVVGLVVCFTLATCIEATDVLLADGQCTVCLLHSLGTQGQFHLAMVFIWNFSC